MYLLRKRALGDVLWIEPVIRQLASRYRSVIVHTKFNDLFENYPLPNVRFVTDLPLYAKILVRLDRLLGTHVFSIDLDGAYEKAPHQHILTAYQKAVGVPVTQEYPRLYLSDEEKNMDFGLAGPYVVLHLESMTDQNYRKVYGVDWSEVSAMLRGRGYRVVQLGKNPVPIPGVLHIPTTIREMITLIARSDLFIGLDSGPSHIAASLNIPSILFFGAVNPAYRHFINLLKINIIQEPCVYAGCFHETSDPGNLVCRIVGKKGKPPCSVHTTDRVMLCIYKALDIREN